MFEKLSSTISQTFEPASKTPTQTFKEKSKEADNLQGKRTIYAETRSLPSTTECKGPSQRLCHSLHLIEKLSSFFLREMRNKIFASRCDIFVL